MDSAFGSAIIAWYRKKSLKAGCKTQEIKKRYELKPGIKQIIIFSHQSKV